MIFQLFNLIILVVFYKCFFLKKLNDTEKGVSTLCVCKDTEYFAAFKEISREIIFIILPIVQEISLLLETAYFPIPVRIAGCFMSFTGMLVYVASDHTMEIDRKENDCIDETTELISTGVCEIIFNPVFLGSGLVHIGFLLTFFNWPLHIITMAGIIMVCSTGK